MNPAADALWTWLNVSIWMLGAVAMLFALAGVGYLAWRGHKAMRAEEDARELKRSAERAADEQAGKVVGMR